MQRALPKGPRADWQNSDTKYPCSANYRRKVHIRQVETTHVKITIGQNNGMVVSGLPQSRSWVEKRGGPDTRDERENSLEANPQAHWDATPLKLCMYEGKRGLDLTVM